MGHIFLVSFSLYEFCSLIASQCSNIFIGLVLFLRSINLFLTKFQILLEDIRTSETAFYPIKIYHYLPSIINLKTTS